jgi:hypothetical protein
VRCWNCSFHRLDCYPNNRRIHSWWSRICCCQQQQPARLTQAERSTVSALRRKGCTTTFDRFARRTCLPLTRLMRYIRSVLRCIFGRRRTPLLPYQFLLRIPLLHRSVNRPSSGRCMLDRIERSLRGTQNRTCCWRRPGQRLPALPCSSRTKTRNEWRRRSSRIDCCKGGLRRGTGCRRFYLCTSRSLPRSALGIVLGRHRNGSGRCRG